MEGDVSDGGAGVETPPSSTAAAGEQQGATSQASSTSAAPAGLSAGANAPAQPSTAPQEARARATAASGTAAPVAGALQSRSMYSSRIVKFEKILSQQVVDLDALRELSWSGIPPHLRADCWRLLLGYLPPHSSKRPAILARKRKEYQDLVPEYYDIDNSERSTDELGALRQVDVDVPRTMPEVAFFHQPVVQKVLSRILYIWGIRHPASGYVQGINDLVAPFLAVFLTEHMSGDISSWHCDGMAEEVMMDAEADSYWCLCKLLDGIQDHYTYAQPGIQRSILALQDLVRRVEEGLTAHMESEGVEFMQFSFRWVNCLLIREVPFSIALRLWDTYLAEGSNLTDFIAYICASFFLMWAQELKRMDFQEMLMFLQKVPTASWTETQVEMVLSKAYMWRATFNEAQSHLG